MGALLRISYSATSTVGPVPLASSVLLKKAAAVAKGNTEPNRDKGGKVSRSQLEEIAKAKMPDLSAYDMDQAVRIIAGSARSMGIETEGV